VQLFYEIIDAFLLRGNLMKRAHIYRSNIHEEAVTINASIRDMTDRMPIVLAEDRRRKGGVHERSSIRNRDISSRHNNDDDTTVMTV